MTPAALNLKVVGDRLAHYYDEVTPAELLRVITEELGDLHAFAREIEAAAARPAPSERES